MYKKIITPLLITVFVLAFAQPAQGAQFMAQNISIPEMEFSPTGTYPPGGTPGVYIVELNTLPGNSEGAEYSMTRVPTNPEGLLAHIEFEFRQSNSSPWQHLMGVDFHGGTILDKQGNVLTVSRGLVTWPGEAGPNGRVMLKGSDVRIVATVSQTFRTAVTINSISSTGK